MAAEVAAVAVGIHLKTLLLHSQTREALRRLRYRQGLRGCRGSGSWHPLLHLCVPPSHGQGSDILGRRGGGLESVGTKSGAVQDNVHPLDSTSRHHGDRGLGGGNIRGRFTRVPELCRTRQWNGERKRADARSTGEERLERFHFDRIAPRRNCHLEEANIRQVSRTEGAPR